MDKLDIFVQHVAYQMLFLLAYNFVLCFRNLYALLDFVYFSMWKKKGEGGGIKKLKRERGVLKLAVYLIVWKICT